MNTTTHIIVSSRVNENKKSCKYTLAEYLGYTLDDLSHVWVVNDTWATESIRCKTKLDETLHLCHEDLIPVPSVDNKTSGGGTSSSSSSSSSMVVANSHQDETHHTNKRAATAETVADHHLSSLLDGVRTTVLIGLDEDDEQLNATRQTLSDPLLRPSTRYLNTTISVKNNGAASSSSSSSSPSSSSSSSPSSPSPASLATPANPLVVKDLSTTTTPYAICLTMDEQDLATTERELDARDQQIKEERQEQETQVLYNVTPNRMLQTTNATTTVGRSSSSSSSSSTPHMTPRQHTPTSTPGNTRTNTTPLVLRRIRQFENAVDGCTSPMRGSQHRLIGVDRHPPSQYPRPGQWMSPHHRVVSNDKKKALQRDYVGLDMNHTPSLQAYKGTGDFLPMAKWLGR